MVTPRQSHFTTTLHQWSANSATINAVLERNTTRPLHQSTTPRHPNLWCRIQYKNYQYAMWFSTIWFCNVSACVCVCVHVRLCVWMSVSITLHHQIRKQKRSKNIQISQETTWQIQSKKSSCILIFHDNSWSVDLWCFHLIDSAMVRRRARTPDWITPFLTTAQHYEYMRLWMSTIEHIHG